MSYDEFKELCRGTWKVEEDNHFYIVKIEKKNEGNFLNCIGKRPNMVI